MIPLGRGPSHLASRCPTIFHPLPTALAWLLCQLHWPLSVSSLLQAQWTAQRGCGLCSQPCEWSVVPGNALRGESPTPRVQIQAWWGQVWLPLAGLYSLISINVTWFYLLRNFKEMEAYVLFFELASLCVCLKLTCSLEFIRHCFIL